MVRSDQFVWNQFQWKCDVCIHLWRFTVPAYLENPGGGGSEALSESPRCNDMVADLHFPRFFGTAIKCEIARRFPRSVVKVGLHVQCKNISVSSGVQTLNLDGLKIIIFQYIICEPFRSWKEGIGKTRCKPMRNLAKIQMSPKRFRPPWKTLFEVTHPLRATYILVNSTAQRVQTF